MIKGKQMKERTIKMKKDKKNETIIDSYDYLGNSASNNDCTGLIPSAPISKSEVQSYEDVYHFTPPEVPIKKCPRDN